MAWIEFLVPIGATLAILIGPGALIASILGLRGLWLWASAAPISLGVFAVASFLSPFLGIRWSILPCLVLTIVVAAVAFGFRVLFRRYRPEAPPIGPRWPFFVGFAVGAVVLVIRMVMIHGTPDAISQSFDNVFHLNAVRYVLETGSGSPLDVGGMTEIPFYPSLWHATVALVVDITGASIPAAVNALTFVAASIVWPLGAMLLVRTLIGTAPAVTIAAGVLSAAFPGYPILLLHYGVLYPLFLGVAVLPVALAATLVILRLGSTASGMTRTAAFIVLALLMPGMSLAHPGALVAWLAFTVPMAVVLLVRSFRRRRFLVPVVLFAVYSVVGVVALNVLRPPASQIVWPTLQTVGQAVGEVLTVSAYFMPVAIGLTVFIAIGILTVVLRRSEALWVAFGIYAMAALLFIVVSASPFESIRHFLTGPWYNNTPRLAGLLPVAMLPIAALGVGAIVEFVVGRSWWQQVRTRIPKGWAIAGVGASVVLLTLGTQGFAMASATAPAQRVFLLADDAWLLTPDELELLEEVPEFVPEGVTIAGNPWTGAGLAFAISDRPVLMPHLLMETSPDMAEINEHLRDAVPGSDVCDAVESTNTGYVIDFGRQQVNNEERRMPGIENLAGSDAVEEVARVGDAALYRIVACTD
ncbi:DUF6541 family protein [Agromyces sp. NPDC056379]|uniref:DUF6541 family protein n=1 Tax=unclassified Agromyces TaxID=2639701 RepID=UPI0035DC8E63